MAWTSIFDNTDWEPGPVTPGGSWNVDHWDARYEPLSDYFVNLEPLSGWETDYRPTKIRVTYTGGQTQRLILRDNNNNYLINTGFNGYSSGTEITIPWDSYDIQYIEIYNTDSNDFDITNIEFLEDDPTTTTTTTTTTTAPEAPIVDLPGSQGSPGGGEFGTVNEGFGGFGFGWS